MQVIQEYKQLLQCNKKLLVDYSQRKYKVFQLNRWQYLKQHKNELTVQALKRLKVRLKAQELLKKLFSLKVLKKIV